MDSGIERSHNTGGNNHLLMYNDGFNSNIKIPTSGGSSNLKQVKRGAEKTRKLHVAVKISNKKSRNELKQSK